ncbi:Ribosome-associated factor Y [Aedoeadaptatus ivorii]|uniref:Ribosome hibernation promoting factor n=1 Tax=Aedoeadaptatus ivorii TaxID=54006 RepID=A0A3S4YLJ3_9FIRM|nr:ribosome-associated translation inhibitor RaiA [Peptoniphilus ivorii]MDQ0508754.1 putative sigma-54 modulation protein [Peptoniphilus ivorii]VEJ36119.1 Ribosome-associated factor Y [Peptoniphilus ivorii]
MRIEFFGKNIELTQALKNQAEKKLSKLDKYFAEEVEAKVTFSTMKGNHTTEITVFLPNTIMRAEETTEDMYASIDLAMDVLERQVRKYKTRLKNRHQGSETIRFENFEQALPEKPEDTQGKIVSKRKHFHLQPMVEEEAALQMELLNHNFFIFLDADIEEPALLYKRRDGNFGRIDFEF